MWLVVGCALEGKEGEKSAASRGKRGGSDRGKGMLSGADVTSRKTGNRGGTTGIFGALRALLLKKKKC